MKNKDITKIVGPINKDELEELKKIRELLEKIENNIKSKDDWKKDIKVK